MVGGKKQPKTARRSSSPKVAFLQPLAVGLLCLLFVALFFVIAIIDAKRVKSTLLDVFENKGLTIIEGVERLYLEKFNQFMAIRNRTIISAQDITGIEKGFQIQELLLTRLIALAREADQEKGSGILNRERLRRIAEREAIFSILLLNSHGQPTPESMPFPKGLPLKLESILKEGNEINVLFGDGSARGHFSCLIAVPRQIGGGEVVLVLDEEGLKWWGSRVALQEAINEAGWRKGVRYFRVFDSRGRLIASAENIPDEQAESKTPPTKDEFLQKDGGGEGAITGSFDKSIEVRAPLRLAYGVVGTAMLGMDIEKAYQLITTNQRHIFLLVAFMIGVAMLATWLFYKSQNSHLLKMRHMEERLTQAERISSLGQIAAGIAHEIRNPLNAIGMAVQRIQCEFGPCEGDDQREFSRLTTVIREEIKRLNRLVEEFLGAARRTKAEIRPQSIIGLLENLVHLLKDDAAKRGVTFQTHFLAPEILVRMDAARMQQAMLNLIKNAVESIVGQGTVTISVKPEGRHRVIISIADTGRGILPDEMKSIFHFEYTTKEKGLGLGLSIAHEIIRAHQGTLSIQSEPGEGTTVNILLPSETNADCDAGAYGYERA